MRRARPAPGTGALMPRPLAAIVVVRTASSASYLCFLPFLGLWLTSRQGLSAPSAAAVVGVSILATRAGGLLLAPVVVRVGLSRSVVLAYAGATALLLCMTQVSSTGAAIWLALAGALGLLSAAASTALKALVVAAFEERQRLRGFAYLNVAVNVGSAAGPVIGGAVLVWDPGLLPLAAAALDGVALMSAAALPRTRSGATRRTTAARLAGRLPSRQFAAFLLLSSATWFAYAQVFGVLAAYVAPTQGAALVGALFTVNAVLIVVLQLPAGRRLERDVPDRSAGPFLRLAAVLLAASLVLFSAVPRLGPAAAVAAMVLFTLSEVLWSPLFDREVDVLRHDLSAVSAFGVAGVVWGLAESAGAAVGLLLLGTSGLGAAPYLLAAALVVAAACAPRAGAR